MAETTLRCTIYVHTTDDLDELIARVARLVEGEVDHWTAKARGFEIAGVPNDEFDDKKALSGSGDFLYFPYLLELEEVTPTLVRPRARQFISDLLDGLREEGLAFVTSAEFEDELPNRGRSSP